jgi:hypothetical protein
MALTPKDRAHGLLLSCACELKPITIIAATKILLRCFILDFLNYFLVIWNKSNALKANKKIIN